MPPRARTDDDAETKSPLSRYAPTLVQTSLWMMTVVFATGVFYSSTSASSERVRKLEADFAAHVTSEGHPVTSEKIRALAATTQKIEQTVESLDATARRIDENMIALCAVVRGAQCTRSTR